MHEFVGGRIRYMRIRDPKGTAPALDGCLFSKTKDLDFFGLGLRGIDKTVERARMRRIYRHGQLIGGDGSGIGEPVRTQVVGLHLHLPPGVALWP